MILYRNTRTNINKFVTCAFRVTSVYNRKNERDFSIDVDIIKQLNQNETYFEATSTTVA